jgi:uncharacterized protein YjbJ (UPF0337 family)
MSVAEKLKGRSKETVGEMTGNKRLEREGKVDRAAENVKEKVDDAAAKVKEILRRRDERQSER